MSKGQEDGHEKDGTIADTKKTIVVSKQETLRQMGLNVADEQACADTIGMSARTILSFI